LPVNQASDFPERFMSARMLRRVLGGKSSDCLSERGLALLIKAGVIPPPIMFGRYRRWRWSAVDAAMRKLERKHP
jgi:hypothetical protein